MKIHTGIEKISKPYASIFHENDWTLNGNYICKNGIVLIHHSWYGEIYFTYLRFLYQGRLYWKHIQGRPYTRIGLARKAGEFVKEVVYETEDT